MNPAGSTTLSGRLRNGEGGLPLGAWMEADHIRLDALWERATELRGAAPAEALVLLREFAVGLRRHIDVEEAVLFPYYEARNPEPTARLTDVLREEHRRIRTALDTLLDRAAGAVTEYGVAEVTLRNVLWAHNAREEGLLYPWLNQPESGADQFDGRIHASLARGPGESDEPSS